MNKSEEFDFSKSLKTKQEDTFFNIQSLFHLSAKFITKSLFRTNISPHQVILLSLVFGIIASFLIIQENKIVVVIGAFLLFYKNVLDKVDGSLARLKGLDSRRGRFYDSISDFIVTFFVFSAIAFHLLKLYNSFIIIITVSVAMIISMLQCSYFIYYQVSFIKISGKETINRVIESITPEDLKNEDKFTLLLQRIFLFIYGWQDKIMYKLDFFLINKLKKDNSSEQSIRFLWYKNKPFLTLASVVSIGTHMLLISVFSILNMFEIYLFVNLILLNLLLISSVFYHYFSVKNRLKTIVNK